MGKHLWRYLINTFLVNTSRSMKKALSLTIDHLAKLTANEADPEIATLKANYLVFHQAFILAYNQLNSRLGIYKGKTMTTEQALEELRNKELNAWRGAVFNIFHEGSADAKAIFPRGRTPFNSGTYEQRIEAVFALHKTLETYNTIPELLTLSSQVLLYYNGLLGTRAVQQKDEGSVAMLRANVKHAHEVMCRWMYKNLGALMMKYFEDPSIVERYFDLSLLRKKDKEKDVVKIGNVGANMQLFVSLQGVVLTAATNMIFENTFNTAGSVIRAQFQSDTNAALDEGRSFVSFQSQFGEVDTDAETAGFNVEEGYIYLVLYANNMQGAFKITIEQ